MSIITKIIACRLNRTQADALNRESGRIYTQVMVEHWRIYRKHGLWLKQSQAERYNDKLNGGSFLHAHSVDAAQQAFYKASQTIHSQRRQGMSEARFPYRRKVYRTTLWKNSGIRKRENDLLLSLARGQKPIRVKLPQDLCFLDKNAFKEMRLVYNRGSRRYSWHLVVDVSEQETTRPGDKVAAIDMGEVHPVALGTGEASVIITCRELRANSQYRNKRLAQLSQAQAKLSKGSRKWRRLQAKKNRFLARNENRQRDMLHKVSRAAIEWCVENEVGKLWIGDVRDIADGKRLHRKSQQKVSNWPHGTLRKYLNDKAEQAGILVDDTADERYTSQTCPGCGTRTKPKGRLYQCRTCHKRFHRDVVGYANILSLNEYGQLGQIMPAEPKYLKPYRVLSRSGGHPASSLVAT